jgi:predicted AlkP superfamily phosphohydrolase/phosphomutase
MAILDAPLSPLDPSLNGIQVLEWGVHDAVYGFRTHPSALGGTLRTSFGEHPVGSLCDGQRRSVDDYGALVDALRQGADTKSKMTRHLLRQGGWDLFMQVFSEAHCAGHQLWHLHDRAHPAHNAGVAAKIGDPLQQVYRAIDTAIGEILDEAGDCMTFVFSSHGMSHWYGANFLLPEILFRLGVAQRPERAASARSPGTFALAVGTWLWHLLPDAVRAGLRGPRERLGLRAAGTSGVPDLDVDPSESRCFHHRNGLAVGGIRLNLAGREPQGTLAPGRQADEFCKTLIDDLTDIVDERSGRPLIRQILKVSDHYRGSHLADLPDLLVVYDDEVPTGSTRVGDGDGARVRVRSPKIGVVEGANTYGRTGEHRPQGLLIADGPGVGVGSCLGSVSVLDLAPTWTHLLGAELHGVDGAAIAGLRRIS